MAYNLGGVRMGWHQQRRNCLRIRFYGCAKTTGKKRMSTNCKKRIDGVQGIVRGGKGNRLGDCHWMPSAYTSWLGVKPTSGAVVSEGSDCGLAWE